MGEAAVVQPDRFNEEVHLKNCEVETSGVGRVPASFAPCLLIRDSKTRLSVVSVKC